MRLIDANALLQHIRKMSGADFGGESVLASDIKKNAPTVDAVEVVRCKDCIHSYDDLCGLCCTCGPYVDCVVQPGFYCADGKRRGAAHGVE